MLQELGEGLLVCMVMPSGSFRASPCVVMRAWLRTRCTERASSSFLSVAACLLSPRLVLVLVPLRLSLASAALCADDKVLSEGRCHAEGRGKGRGQQRRALALGK